MSAKTKRQQQKFIPNDSWHTIVLLPEPHVIILTKRRKSFDWDGDEVGILKLSFTVSDKKEG